MKKYLLILSVLILTFSLLIPLQSCTSKPDSEAALVFELEELTVNTFPPNLAIDHDGEGASKGVWSNIKSFAENQWLEYSIYIEEPGTYNVEVTSKYYPKRAIYQLYVENKIQGNKVDQYAEEEAFVTNNHGNVTFLEKGYKILKFEVRGKNKSSSGYRLGLDKFTLTPTKGFTLLSPNKSYTKESDVVLRWNAYPETKNYKIYIDRKLIATVPSETTSYQITELTDGKYKWYVESINENEDIIRSNILSFTVGEAPANPHRNFSDNFESGLLVPTLREAICYR